MARIVSTSTCNANLRRRFRKNAASDGAPRKPSDDLERSREPFDKRHRIASELHGALAATDHLRDLMLGFGRIYPSSPCHGGLVLRECEGFHQPPTGTPGSGATSSPTQLRRGRPARRRRRAYSESFTTPTAGTYLFDDRQIYGVTKLATCSSSNIIWPSHPSETTEIRNNNRRVD